MPGGLGKLHLAPGETPTNCPLSSLEDALFLPPSILQLEVPVMKATASK
jgi:hypothetical protein